MINGQQMLAARAHCALGVEEIFGRGLVGYQWICGEVTQAINTLTNSVCSAADEAAAFVGIRFARMRKEFLGLRLCERNHPGLRKRGVALPPDVRKGFAFPFRDD